VRQPEPIAEITEEGIAPPNVEVHEVDTIVYGTGFLANELPSPRLLLRLEGRGCGTTARLRRGVPRLTVAGYPNLFTLLRPNTTA